jgi:hypothetical protein
MKASDKFFLASQIWLAASSAVDYAPSKILMILFGAALVVASYFAGIEEHK